MKKKKIKIIIGMLSVVCVAGLVAKRGGIL